MKYYTEREDVIYIVRQFTGEQCAIIHCAPEPGKEFPELFGENPISITKSKKLSEGIFYISFQDNDLKINDSWWCVVEGTPVTDVVNFFLNYREKAIEEALIASVKVIQENEFTGVPWQDLVTEYSVGGLELSNVSGSDNFIYYTFLNEERKIKATVQVPCFEGRGIKVFWDK
jgi:hypothetical protein